MTDIELGMVVLLVRPLLEENGFTENPDFYFTKPGAVIHITTEGYEVANEEGSMFSSDHNIYWLVGNLIMREIIAPEEFRKQSYG